jgi:hypothetical protein
MPKFRTVSKSKSDGVKNKTVTYAKGGTTVTKTKTKKRGVDGKTPIKKKSTTVSDRGRTLATGYKIKQGGRTTDKMKTATGRGGTFVETEMQTNAGAKTKYRRTANSGSMTKTKGGGVKTKDGRTKRGSGKLYRAAIMRRDIPLPKSSF